MFLAPLQLVLRGKVYHSYKNNSTLSKTVYVWILFYFFHEIILFQEPQPDECGRGLTLLNKFEEPKSEMDYSPLHVPRWRAVQSVQPLLQRGQDLGVLHHLRSQLTSCGEIVFNSGSVGSKVNLTENKTDLLVKNKGSADDAI